MLVSGTLVYSHFRLFCPDTQTHKHLCTQHHWSRPPNDGPFLVDGWALSFTSCFDLASDRLKVMPDMMRDCLFTPSGGDGSSPLRAGPHYGNIWESHGGAGDEGEQKQVGRKTLKCQSTGKMDDNRKLWKREDMHDERMDGKVDGKGIMMWEKKWQTWHSQLLEEKVKKVVEVENYDFVALIWDESKVRKRGRKTQEKQGLMKRNKGNEEWLTGDGTNDATFSVTARNINNKHT